MHISCALVVGFLASLPSIALAGCYTSGEHFHKPADALSIDDAANHYKGNSYEPGKEIVWCKNISGHSIKFILENKLANKQTISYDRAYTGFEQEYSGCDQGGDSSYDDWRFVVDPGAGSCS